MDIPVEAAPRLFHFSIDLGQTIIAVLIGIVGYFIKRTIDTFARRIDRHESILFKMAQDIQYIIGAMGLERRRNLRPILSESENEQ